MLCWMSNNAAACPLFCCRIARGPTLMRPHTMPHANRCRASIAAALQAAAAQCAARARNEGARTHTTQKPHSKSHTTAPLANRPLCNCCCHPTVPQKQLRQKVSAAAPAHLRSRNTAAKKNTSAHPTKGIDRCPATAGSCSCGINPIRCPCRQTSDIPSLKRTALQHGSRTKHTAGTQNVSRRRPTPLYSKKGRPEGITIRGPLQSSAMCYELQQTLVNQSKITQAPCGTHTPTGTDAHTEASRGNSATQQQLQITRRLACRSQLRMTARCGKRIHTCHRLHQQHLKSAR